MLWGCSGPTVVLINGFGTTMAEWGPILPQLLAQASRLLGGPHRCCPCTAMLDWHACMQQVAARLQQLANRPAFLSHHPLVPPAGQPCLYV